jgi:hypothetical protein
MSWFKKTFRKPPPESLIPESYTPARHLPKRDWDEWERSRTIERSMMETPTKQECGARFPPGTRLGLTRLGGNDRERRGTVTACHMRLGVSFAKVRLDDDGEAVHLALPRLGLPNPIGDIPREAVYRERRLRQHPRGTPEHTATLRHLLETGHPPTMFHDEFEARDSRNRAFAVRVL